MPRKLIRFRDLKARDIVRNWPTLKRWIDVPNVAFPPASTCASNHSLVRGRHRRLARGAGEAAIPGRVDARACCRHRPRRGGRMAASPYRKLCCAKSKDWRKNSLQSGTWFV